MLCLIGVIQQSENTAVSFVCLPSVLAGFSGDLWPLAHSAGHLVEAEEKEGSLTDFHSHIQQVSNISS